MKKLLTLSSLLLSSLALFSQPTQVIVGTIIDSDAITWANGSWKIEFVPNSQNSNTGAYNVNGVPLPANILSQGGPLDSSGHFTSQDMSGWTSNLITPAGSSYKLTACPNASAPCGSYTFPLNCTTGTACSLDVSSGINAAIPAVRFKAISGSYGYADIEAITQEIPGSTYFNVTANAQKTWNGTIWVASGTGNGNIIPSPQNSIMFQPVPGSSATAQGDPGIVTDGAGGLYAKSFGGYHIASQNQTPPGTGNNGIFNTVQSGNLVIADPAYANVEKYVYGFSSIYNPPTTFGQAPQAAQSHVIDYRGGVTVDTYRDPIPGTFNANYNIGYTLNYQNYLHQGTATYGRPISLMVLSNFWAPSGYYGSSGPGPTNMTSGAGISIVNASAGPGVHQGLVVSQYKTGIGDNTGAYFYNYSYGGAVGGSDEGNHGVSWHGDEAVTTFKGTVSTGGAGATTVKVTCTTDCLTNSGGPGDGRYLIDTTDVRDSGNITAQVNLAGSTPNTFTIDHNITPSTAIGLIANATTFTGNTTKDSHTISSLSSTAGLFSGMTVTGANIPSGGYITTVGASSIDLSVNASLTATGTTFTAGDCNAGAAPQPFGTAYNTVTCVVNQTGGTGTFTAGSSLVCFEGTFHEQALITSVSGAGPYALTMNLRHTHARNTMIAQGGPCGTFLNLTANDATASTLLHFPIDIIGAPDATHYYTAFFYLGLDQGKGALGGFGSLLVNQTLAATNLTNIGGIVYLGTTINANVPWPVGSTIQIYNASGGLTGYNGPCTNVKWQSSTNQIYCTQSSSNGLGVAATANFNTGTSQYGNGDYTVWPGAEVLDVLDHSVNPPVIYNSNIFTLTLEPNNAAWTVTPTADAVEQPHHYSLRLSGAGSAIPQNRMLGDSKGLNISIGGNGSCCGGGVSNGVGFHGLTIDNTGSSTSMYYYHGGTVTPPSGIALNGLFNYGLGMLRAPDPIASSAIAIGCPISGCADVNYFYNMFNATGNAGSSGLQVRPYSNTMLTSGNWVWQSDFGKQTFRDSLTFGPLAVPTLNNPTTATTGGNLPAATYFYTVYAKNNTGFGLQSVEKSIVVPSGTTNSNSLSWTRVMGATIYVICRSTTTGTELTGPSLNGGDSLSYVDNGSNTFTGAACNTTDTSRAGTDNAAYAGLENPNNTTQTKLVAGTATTNISVTVPSVAGTIPVNTVTPTAGKATCWKTTTTIGYCSTQPDSTGACTCN